jgi:predicted lipid-binding transport protein (Tim44 family)
MLSFVDIIFLTILVVFIATRLYGLFGSHGEKKNIRVIIKPLDENTDVRVMENLAQLISDNEKEIVSTVKNSKNNDIFAKIGDFNKEKFLESASRVFEMILQAFNSGNIENIKGLVSKKIWDAFNGVLNFRKENNITSEVDFICFRKKEIKDIKLLKNSVKIVVEFESEQINILKDSSGQVLEGDENFVQNITDVWTFERLLNAKNKNWTLVSTKKGA